MIALHGFLGSGADFDPFFATASPRGFCRTRFTPDLFAPQSKYLNATGFSEWVPKFLEMIPSTERDLMGYSFGGRLALHLAVAAPERWDRVFLVSAFPGLLNAEEKAARLKADVAWAEKFTVGQDWAEALVAWNSQSVFRGSQEPVRYEGDFNRTLLTRALTEFSWAQMQISSEQLAKLQNVYWICGERDTKYLSLYTQLREQRLLKNVYVLPKAGHRAIFDNPQGLAELLEPLAKL